ncbi:Transient receptor potential cation channel trpm [Taenia crassiceps]|uniref:Transient receptor potential cation channel trpm n=1 Tax=Taenia crassiceps TaxID=6207 RepID=A0ABR4QHR2_9CEST
MSNSNTLIPTGGGDGRGSPSRPPRHGEHKKLGVAFNVGSDSAQGPTISLPHSLDIKDAKKAFALKIAGALPSGGSSPAKIIQAFIHVKDYEGLNRYLSKYTVDKEVLDFALQKACIASNAEAVDVLASHGANVDFVDQFGTTLLHFAMRGGGNPEVILALLRHGMQHRDWRNEGQNLLNWACQWGHLAIVSDLIENRGAEIHEDDNHGRLPIHVAATYGRPSVLSYLIEAYSHRLRPSAIPKVFLDAIAELNESDEDRDSLNLDVNITVGRTSEDPSKLAKVAAAANYLDSLQRTPLHCASSEEAVNDYPECISILLESGGDPMLRTLQGKTALDLAYEAGRARVLIDIMPTAMMVELLMRINDVVPRSVRQKHSENISTKRTRESPSVSIQQLTRRVSISATRSSLIRRQQAVTPSDGKEENVNHVAIWRKILLNDDVELLESWRDSLLWCQEDPGYLKKRKEIRGRALNKSPLLNKKSPMDFETSQGLTAFQRSELFFDCYENGTGVYSYIQSNFAMNIKAHDFLTVLRSLTGLVVFEQLMVDGVVILSPLHTSILFLALLCGRFRVAEQLLRMRQFDLIPASVLVVLILHRLYQEPTFPEQVRCELQQIASLVEAIAVDVLTLVSLKDNTPEKEICRGILNAPLRICGDLSLIDLCAQAKCTNLLSLPICQRVLDERWRGVLIHLPNWIGFVSRFCPLVAIAFLERRARKERAKALADFIADAASYTAANANSTNNTKDPSVETNFFGPFNKDNDPWKSTTSSLASPHKRRTRSKDHSTSILPMIRLKKASAPTPLTVYDRLSRQYGWQGSPRLSFVKAIYTSPEVKFFFHSIFHVIFLVTFTLVLVNSLHFKIRLTECGAITYVIGYAVEEIRQIIIESLRGQFINYLKDSWNTLEIFAIAFTLSGFWARVGKINQWAPPEREAYDISFYSARVCYLFGLHLFCMRTLFITSISPIIGPRLKMMADMLRKDLVPLLIVFAIFLFSYGVSFQGLMYPNSYIQQTLSNGTKVYERMPFLSTVEKLISRAFYSIFEVSVALEEAECRTDEQCGSQVGNKLVILFVLIAYTVIVNLILINLLIALFSNTVSRIGMQSTAHWLADRYQMVKEYQDKSMFPPPLNLLSILVEICFCSSQLCLCCRRQQRRKNAKGEDKGNNGRSGIGGHRSHISASESRSSEDLDDIESQHNIANNTHMGVDKEELEFSHSVAKRKWNKQLRNSRRVQKLTHNLRSALWNRRTETEAVLQFILVQSFALKDRRYTVGSTSATLPSGYSVIATAAGTIEHRLQALEKRLDDWLPRLMEELKALREAQRSPFSPPDFQMSQTLETGEISERFQLNADGLQAPTLSESSERASGISMRAHQPHDLLYRRPVSKL